MPVSVVACESRRIEAHDQSGLAKADLRDQRLKAVPVLAGGSRLAKVVVDDMNPLSRPAEQHGPLDQPILQLGAFLMMPYLPRRGLPDIDIGELGTVRGRDALIVQRRHAQHDVPPLTGRLAAVRAAGDAPRAAPADAASRPEAAATGVAAPPARRLTPPCSGVAGACSVSRPSASSSACLEASTART